MTLANVTFKDSIDPISQMLDTFISNGEENKHISYEYAG